MIFKKFLKYSGITLLLILVSVFIWIRFFVSEFDELKNSTIFEHRKGIATDGAHVLYEKDSVRIISVDEISDNYEISDNRYSKSEFNQSFVVNTYSYDEPSAISFTVNLMDSITIPKPVYPNVEKLVAISDIEGNIYAFHKLLKACNIIDENSNWIFGKGHLVLVGDFVDRGLNVTQCLWLIYKMEKQAQAKGGCVHFILGNHELNNLNGRNYHVRTKYTKLASKLRLDYSKDFYGINSELGRWLRTKNTIEKIGNLLFVHGGINQDLTDLEIPIEKINQIVRKNIGNLNYTDSISQHVHGNASPLTDRGLGHGKNSETHRIIENAKQCFNVSTIVIGHSTTSNIRQQFNGGLINIDVHFPHKDSDENRGAALLIEADMRFTVDDFGNKVKI